MSSLGVELVYLIGRFLVPWKPIDPMILTMATAAQTLEAAGAGIMMRSSLVDIGGYLTTCGEQFQSLSESIATLSPDQSNGLISSQRMAYAAEKNDRGGSTTHVGDGGQRQTERKGMVEGINGEDRKGED